MEGVCGVWSWGDDDDEADEVVRMVLDRGRDMGGVLGMFSGEARSDVGVGGRSAIWAMTGVILTGRLRNWVLREV